MGNRGRYPQVLLAHVQEERPFFPLGLVHLCYPIFRGRPRPPARWIRERNLCSLKIEE
jgi:hypothetical protein